MRSFPQISLAAALYRVPVIQGRALIAGAIAVDPMTDATVEEGYIRAGIRERLGK